MSDISIGRFRGGFCVYWRVGGKRTRHQLKALTVAEAEAEAVDVFRRETYSKAPKAPTVAEIWEKYGRIIGAIWEKNQPRKPWAIPARPFWRTSAHTDRTRSRLTCAALMPVTEKPQAFRKALCIPNWATYAAQ